MDLIARVWYSFGKYPLCFPENETENQSDQKLIQARTFDCIAFHQKSHMREIDGSKCDIVRRRSE
jgi:hypothetical protein